MDAVGFIELNSIARGIEAADIVLKSSDVQLISASAGCPGKYYFLFCGKTAAVKEALSAGVEIGRENVVDSTVISNVHPDVSAAMARTTKPPIRDAVGVMEFFSVTAAIYAADAAAKAADITLIEIRCGLGIGGKAYVTLGGDVAAVKAAVSAGITPENAMGMLVGTSVIPNPDKKLFGSLF